MMKELKLVISADFSEAAVEQAMLDMRNYTHKDNFSLVVNVSVFDVHTAIDMMIDQKMFRAVRYVHITPEFRSGEWSIVDELNEVYIKSSCMD